MALLNEGEKTPDRGELPNSTFLCNVATSGGEAEGEHYYNEKFPTFNEFGMYTDQDRLLEDTGSSCSSSSSGEVTLHKTPFADSQTNLSDDCWRIYPNLRQSRGGFRCRDHHQTNPGSADEVNSDGETISPSITDSPGDVSPCSTGSGIMIECPSEKSDAKEECEMYRGEGLINSSRTILSEPQRDEVSLPDHLSNTKNFDLKSSSSSNQISIKLSAEQQTEFQGVFLVTNTGLLSEDTTTKNIPPGLNSCTTHKNSTYPIQQTDHNHSKQKDLPSDVPSSCRMTIGGQTMTGYNEEKDEDIYSDNHAVKNNNENHHRLLRIRKNCTRVSEFHDSKPVALHVHPQDANEKDRYNPGEEHQIPAVKEIKSGEEQNNGISQTDGRPAKHAGRRSSKKIESETVPVNTLTLRKAYDEKQRAETRKRMNQKPKVLEEHKESVRVFESHRRRRGGNFVQRSQMVSTEKVFNYNGNKQLFTNNRLKENIAIYNGPGRILIVKMESETCRTSTIDSRACYRLENGDSPKCSTPRDKSNGDDYEDDFECDYTDDTTIPSTEDDDSSPLQNSLRSEQQMLNGSKCARNENSYVEIARRLKSSVSSRNSLFTRSVCNSGCTTTSSELLPSTTETGPHRSNGTDSEERFVRFPPIELNNLISRRFPRNAFSQDKIGLFKKQQVKEQAAEVFRRRSEQLHVKPQRYSQNGRTQKFPAVKRRAENYSEITRGRAMAQSRDKRSRRRYTNF